MFQAIEEDAKNITPTIISNNSNGNRTDTGDEDELTLQGYTRSLVQSILTIFFVILSGGLLLIFFAWKPSMKVRASMKKCPIDQAETLIIKDKNGSENVEAIHQSEINRSFCYRYFRHKKLKYIWNSEYKHFVKLKGLESEKCSVLYSQAEGASEFEAAIKIELYGKNSIEVELLPIWKLVLNEIAGPFYLYQFFIIVVWLIQWYYQFAACIFILSTISVATHVWQTRKQTIALRKKVQSSSIVTVMRDSVPAEKCSTELVPGDVIILPKHLSTSYLMECDAVLMTGSCILDESVLTGESIPVPKVPLVENFNAIYSSSLHKSNTLFSGTKLLSVSAKDEIDVKAVVVRTGFSTAKGELARRILYPIELNNNLKKQMIKMCAIFFAIGVPCMVYTFLVLNTFKFPLKEVLIIVLDIGTFLIPPVLPAVLTSVNVHAQRRLKKEGLYCLNPQAICCAGEIDVMCFDKTGTLTEDSIDFAGLILAQQKDGNFSKEIITNIAHQLPFDNIAVKTMATCNSLVEYKGHLEGDDLDIKLFTASEWSFVQDIDLDLNEIFGKIPERLVAKTSESGNQLIGIVKQFPFESFLQRMLVLVKDVKENKIMAIVKGAPETIVSFCLPETVPKNFSETFDIFTSKGFRVLAFASKVTESKNIDQSLDMSRNELENSMTFNGLFLFKNKLKEKTTEILKELYDVRIRCLMATGDNLFTATNVSQECNMIKQSEAIIRIQAILDKTNQQLKTTYCYIKRPLSIPINDNNDNIELGDLNDNSKSKYHIAIDGESFDLIKNFDLKLFKKLVNKGTVFARMTPDQKLNLIQALREQDHSVGMCGDGCNDGGALRAADAGIAISNSISVAEASVASSFTYKQKDISCVISLIKEGRCSLVSVYGTFKYQVSYCFILLGAVLVLFWHGFKPSDGTYVFVDIIMNILPPMLFGTTKPHSKLSKQMPLRNLLGIIPQLSMYSFILIQVFFYNYARWRLVNQSWYQPVNNNDIAVPLPNQISHTVFSCNMLSYVIAAIIFAPGPPHRQGFFSNKIYILTILLNLFLSILVVLIGPSTLLDFLEFIPMPFEFRVHLVLVSLINFSICLIWEKYVLYGFLSNHLLPLIKKKLDIKSKKKFKQLDEQILNENWPFDNFIENSKRMNSTNIEMTNICVLNSESKTRVKSKMNKSASEHIFKETN